MLLLKLEGAILKEFVPNIEAFKYKTSSKLNTTDKLLSVSSNACDNAVVAYATDAVFTIS
jgi:hypothetical protein